MFIVPPYLHIVLSVLQCLLFSLSRINILFRVWKPHMYLSTRRAVRSLVSSFFLSRIIILFRVLKPHHAQDLRRSIQPPRTIEQRPPARGTRSDSKVVTCDQLPKKFDGTQRMQCQNGACPGRHTEGRGAKSVATLLSAFFHFHTR